MTDDFQPDWMSAPGATLAQLLEDKKISIERLAKLINVSQDHARRLLTGRAVITREIAERLAKQIGGTAQFWAAREEQFRQDVARLQAKGRESAARLWLNELPVIDMLKHGWLKAGGSVEDRVKAMLKFFDVPNVDVWRRKYGPILSVVNFRTSLTYHSEPGAVLSWLRRGEILSEKISCKKWDVNKFKSQLEKIRSLTHIKDVRKFLPQLQKLCAECGVSLAIAKAPKGCKASGATRFLSPTKAMILLSFRHLTDDHFWFTFFHEAAHLILHSSQAIFIEDGSDVTEREEAQANEFAAYFLIPEDYRSEVLSKTMNEDDILRTAAKFKISRGIVVGQLQHAGLVKREDFNYLKRRYKWEDIAKAISL